MRRHLPNARAAPGQDCNEEPAVNDDQTEKQDPEVAEDRPATGDRGWRGLAREPGEREAFLGIVAMLVVVVLATLVFGLPGLFISFLVVTLLAMVVLVVISMGQ